MSAPSDESRATGRPSPPTPADLWNNRQQPSKKGPAIAPIWILVGFSVILLGVLFGQLFAPSSAAAANEVARSPAPEETGAAVYGTGPGNSNPSPAPTYLPGRTRRGSRPAWSGDSSPAPYGDPSPTPDDPYGSDPQRYNTEAQISHLKFPSAAQIYTATDSVPAIGAGSNSTPQPADTTQVVTVYSRDNQASSAPISAPPTAPVVIQPATMEGDTQRMTEGSATVMQRMPSEVQTPAPVDIPASTRVEAQLNVPTDSDLLGPITAQLSQSYCDPRTGALAWPRGSWITLHLEPVLYRDQRHLALNADYITFPDLTKQSLAKSTVVEDEEGHTGIAGKRNTHTWSIFRDTVIGSIANASGNILSALAQKANTTAPVVVVPGQTQGAYGTSTTLELPTIEVGRSVPFELVLTADYTANKPYDEPGWHGCRS